MSLRERVLLVLGVIGAIALVVYPMAYRLSTEQDRAATAATPAVATSSLPVAATTPAPSIEPTPVATIGPAIDPGWLAVATRHRGQEGAYFEYACPPDGVFGPIWGSDPYTDDLSVCTAGVHKGVITRETGGSVTIKIRPGLASYEGTTRNGVTTEPYGPWDGSYEIVEYEVLRP